PTIAVILDGINELAVSEAGTTDTYMISLASPPSTNVMITVFPDSQCSVNGSVNPITLTFTRTGSSRWSNPQTVTVGAVNDGLIEGDHTCTISHAVAAGSAAEYVGTSISNVVVDITDNNSIGITVSPISGHTSESGAAATFTIVLNSRPQSDVTIELTSSNISEGTVAPTSVTFTPETWNDPRTITVTGVDDGIPDGDATYTIITSPAIS